MAKKWIITTTLLILVCLVAYFVYSAYNKTLQNPTTEEKVSNNNRPAPPIRQVLTPEKKEIADAIISKMSSVMASKNVKQIRDFTMSLYSTQEEKDAVNKIPDAQILRSAQFFKEFKIGESIANAITFLPDSAWNISSSTATITQSGGSGNKVTYTATKVNGIWK